MSEEDFVPRTFSQMYERPDANSGDNAKVRLRLAKAFQKAVGEDHIAVKDAIEGLVGIDGPSGAGLYFDNWPEYFKHLEWRDCRNCVSALFDYLLQKANTQRSSVYSRRLTEFFRDVNRVFAEENVLAKLDRDGIVHPKVDQAFEVARTWAVRGVETDEFEAARRHLDEVEAALLKDPVDGAQAIYRVFLAAENIYKQMTNDDRLTKRKAEEKLQKTIAQVYKAGSSEVRVANRHLAGFCEWIEAAHSYRHEPGEPTPSQPPDELCILSVSSGYAYVRWLSDLKRLAAVDRD
ncbi:hypothetical protein GS634_03120 [Ruegeria atlantica]|uniref:Uncharacterized protein n=1 Tax=Ruegeria atlantica TaxID=81569 RepID=A0AA91BM13_9RHOB|nr:hypothetical protein [Ruegeria atlantica]NOE17110.1 hypothetical protein [Ruegeria atlantica]